MSYSREKWSSAARQTKELAIPDKVPIGVVIGRGGSYCRSLREKHGVSCFVDTEMRKVTLKGDQSSLKNAEDELAELFASFEIANPRAESVIEDNDPRRQSRGGSRRVHVTHPSAQWSFEIGEHASSDMHVRYHPYRLKQTGQGESAANVAASENDFATLNPWIKRISEIIVAFGKLCFKPLSTRFPKSTISWTELQKLEPLQDFEVRWSNVCVRPSSPLLNDLEVEMEKGVPLFSTISVTLTDKKRKEYELDYHLVDGQWKLQSGRARRVVRSKFDVFVDNDTSLRVRGFTCETISDNVLDNLQQLVSFSTPDTNSFFDTKVSLRRSAPYGLALRWAVPKLKFHLEIKGLHFTVSYLDQHRKEFRLECRLPAVDEEPSDEGQELLKRVLQVIRD